MGLSFDSPFQAGEISMERKKVELLAPAGNYESFLGAVHAGADAVYLAGNQFGARAYADNFSEEEVCSAIRYAHLFRRKVYLTVNILLKDREMENLYDYLKPYYECGLDGVIVQDIGAFQYIKEQFPGLELHVSTQMTLTGVNGVRLLKKMGASRIVPARELSIEEIRDIRENVDIEIEAFVHGAMCYCYSGACLFSSILGGRSGNRGRCAQPCRLPYEVFYHDKKVTKEEQYILSLKDMCTIQMIPKLIESGIDSFKIEGRMKKPEYTAGVTAMYRKYIDLYYADPEHFSVDKKDIERIKKLYIRSELQDGYYKKHNGKEMVSLSKPSYSGSDEQLLHEIHQKYLESRKQLSAEAELILSQGRPVICTLLHKESGTSVTVSGQIAEIASKHPVEEESIRRQMLKTGNTNFNFSDIIIKMDTQIFISLKAINEIRRNALEQLETKLLQETLRNANVRKDAFHKTVEKVNNVNIDQDEITMSKINVLYAVVNKKEQFSVLLRHDCVKRIYLSTDCLFDANRTVKENLSEFTRLTAASDKTLYFAMPYMIRKRSKKYLEELAEVIQTDMVSGVLVRNLETLGWLQQIGYQKRIVTDAQIYCFNKKSKAVLRDMADSMTVPYELNLKELLQLGLEHMEIPVYGRIPMMVTANCVQKTAMQCIRDSFREDGGLELKDRYKKKFPVVVNCTHCFNIIYNGQPTSLHAYIAQFKRHNIEGIRLDFTVENEKEVDRITAFFNEACQEPDRKKEPPYKEYTKGHLGRGVE